jgi:TPP-dependent pyruvate/acetoin dehydrogenase alpha subunit
LSEKTGEPEWQNYDPSKAFSREQEREAQDSKLVELRESLDEACREAMQEALEAPPPATVRAYASVFGRLPRGWPPVP